MHRIIKAVALAAILATPAKAAETIKLLVPFAAGGPTDLFARIIAPDLGKELGGTVIVENRGGAGGTIGTAAATREKADGRTLLLTTSALVLSAGTMASVPYDAQKDVEPVYLLGEVQTMIAVRPSLGVNDLKGLVEKAKGTKLNYGSTGSGGTMHLGAELLAKSAKVAMEQIAYRGAAPALTDLIAGSVDFVNADVPILRQYVKDGRLKGLVIFDTKRSALLPEIPNAVEAGMPDLMLTNWYGVLMPKGAAPAQKQKIADAIAKVVKQPQIAAKLADNGLTDPQDTAAFKARLDADFARWLPWLKANGIRAE
ncbi:Bug family tripartite tricarboxylate transporter substrate binding protein [Bosea sp. NPDC055332]